jgi:hypothetical protein
MPLVSEVIDIIQNIINKIQEINLPLNAIQGTVYDGAIRRWLTVIGERLKFFRLNQVDLDENLTKWVAGNINAEIEYFSTLRNTIVHGAY